MLTAHSRRHPFLDAALERVNYLRLSREDELLLLLHTHMLTEERDLLVHDVLIFRLELQPRLDAAIKSQPKMTARAQSLPACCCRCHVRRGVSASPLVALAAPRGTGLPATASHVSSSERSSAHRRGLCCYCCAADGDRRDERAVRAGAATVCVREARSFCRALEDERRSPAPHCVADWSTASDDDSGAEAPSCAVRDAAALH